MSEDHKNSVSLRTLVTCLALPAIFSFAQVSWSPHLIHDNTHGASSIYVCDLDNDSDLDIAGSILEDNQMVWWRNEGGSPIIWTKFVIGYNFAQAFSVYAADLDDDGDRDVIGAAGAGDEIAWWSNNGGNPIQWTKYTIRSGYDFAHEVYAHDLDEDGDMDVLGASTNLDLISWWRNEGGNPVQWTEQTIGVNFDGAKSVRVADLDDDGDNDVVGACLDGNKVNWWRNDGGDPIQWTEFNIDSYLTGAHRVQIIDLDGDQDLDILAAGYLVGQIAWYSNDGGNPIQWTKQIIGANFHGACIAQAADFDGDGDLDVAGSAQVSSQLAWWRNDGGNPIVWTRYFIDDYFYRTWPLYVCDLDDDSDPDAVAASSWQGTNEVKWYENTGTGIIENQTSRTVSRNLGPTIITTAAMLRLEPGHRIYDITGREINPTCFAPGIYFIETEDHAIQKVIRIE